MSTVSPGEKFAVVAVTEAGLREGLPGPIDLGGGLYLLNGPPFALGPIWSRWLGDILVRELGRANLWLLARAPSTEVETANEENERLKETVGYLFHAILLTCPLPHNLALRINGANTGSMVIRGFQQLDHYFNTPGLETVACGGTDLTTSGQVMTGLIAIFNDNDSTRIQSGLRAFWQALKERDLQDRLHEFVRTMEGVIKPEIGATKKQFIHRCQTFTGARSDAAQFLGECFDIRSNVEHLHDWYIAVPHIGAADRVPYLECAVRRLETLSRVVYTRLATSRPHWALFQDIAIDGFWGLPDHERSRQWGRVLDIMSIT